MINNLRRRIERLERILAMRTAPRPDVELTPAERHLALVGMVDGLQAAWDAIDAGTFTGNDYHRRGLDTLRQALDRLGSEANDTQ